MSTINFDLNRVKFDFSRFSKATLAKAIKTHSNGTISVRVIGTPVDEDVAEILAKSNQYYTVELYEAYANIRSNATRPTPFNAEPVFKMGSSIEIGSNIARVIPKEADKAFTVKAVNGQVSIDNIPSYGAQPFDRLAGEICADVASFAAVTNKEIKSTVAENCHQNLKKYHCLVSGKAAELILSKITFPKSGTLSGNDLSDFIYANVEKSAIEQKYFMMDMLASADPDGCKIKTKYTEKIVAQKRYNLRTRRMPALITPPYFTPEVTFAYAQTFYQLIGPTGKGMAKVGFNMIDGFPVSDKLREAIEIWTDLKTYAQGICNVFLDVKDPVIAQFVYEQLDMGSVLLYKSEAVTDKKSVDKILTTGGICSVPNYTFVDISDFIYFNPVGMNVSDSASYGDVCKCAKLAYTQGATTYPDCNLVISREHYMLATAILKDDGKIVSKEEAKYVPLTKAEWYEVADPELLKGIGTDKIKLEQEFSLFSSRREKRFEEDRAERKLNKIRDTKEYLVGDSEKREYTCSSSIYARYKKILVISAKEFGNSPYPLSVSQLLAGITHSIQHYGMYHFHKIPYAEVYCGLEKFATDIYRNHYPPILVGKIKFVQAKNIGVMLNEDFSSVLSNADILSYDEYDKEIVRGVIHNLVHDNVNNVAPLVGNIPNNVPNNNVGELAGADLVFG